MDDTIQISIFEKAWLLENKPDSKNDFVFIVNNSFPN